MIKLAQLKAAIAQIKSVLPPTALPRWAFLVTPEEIVSIVDECQSDADTGLHMPSEHAKHIKECRALLHIDGIAIMPEYMEPPTFPLDS